MLQFFFLIQALTDTLVLDSVLGGPVSSLRCSPCIAEDDKNLSPQNDDGDVENNTDS